MRNFKKTARVVLALLLCVLMLYAGYTAPYFYGTAYYYQDASARSALRGSLNLLISGSSHAFRAFIPEQLDRTLGTESYNLACSMQTMEGRYHLLCKELERNPVQTVVIELSYNALTRSRAAEGPEGDLYQLGRYANPLDRWAYFFTAFSPSEYGEVYHDTLTRSAEAWKKLLTGEMGLQSVRGYLGLDPVDQRLPENERAAHFHTQSLSVTQDPESVFYFERSMELCAAKGLRVILVTTPMPTRTLLEFDGLETVRGWYAAYAERYGCEFYDFNLLKTADYPDETAFFDASHLSRSGAEAFTADFCTIVQQAARGEDVSARFYPDYDRLLQALLQP